MNVNIFSEENHALKEKEKEKNPHYSSSVTTSKYG
jgi:hypothetical protein